MMRRLGIIRHDGGSSAVEFALAVPVLVTMIWGMFQISLLFEANAGVQQALGEGARQATIYDPATAGPVSTTVVQNKITSSKFGVAGGTWDTPTIDTSHETAANGGYWVISVSYHVPTNFLFFHGPTVTISKSKTVYLSI